MEVIDTYDGIRHEIYAEFSSLLDYIWKTPRFIEDQVALERRKLDAYFPAQNGPNANPQMKQLRQLRSMDEGLKLFHHFPRYMAASNLFLATSTFELFLHKLCKDVERHGHLAMDERRSGVRRYFTFLGVAGFQPEQISVYVQVNAAIMFRNALLHADGRMDICRDRLRIEQIVRKLEYLEPARRDAGGQIDEDGRPEVSLSDEPSQLRITNFYAYRATAYFKRFLLEIAKDLTGSKS